MPAITLAVMTALVVGGCGDSAPAPTTARAPSAYGVAPEVPPGPPSPAAARGARALVDGLVADGRVDGAALGVLVAEGDARQAWLLSDLLRFVQFGADEERVVTAFADLTGSDPRADPAFGDSAWLSVTNTLIAWDLPAAPGYVEAKAVLFQAVEPGWKPFFDDRDSEIDWRLTSWGGVPIDDRPSGDTQPCPEGCIPALDDPALTAIEQGDWYPDDAIVFGVEVAGEAVALPRNIMEIHEMVNLTLGGRRLGIPYCTLCASAQAYLTDTAGTEQPAVLRTSGLLTRSNKVMYDLRTQSVLDTFTGQALSGPLHDEGVTLEQVTVTSGTWEAFKREHPDGRIIARDGGIGREYDIDPLDGRDDDGPIFPTGPVDPRLPVQARVVGVIAPDGSAIAFDAEQARVASREGEPVTARGVVLVPDGGGFVARATDGGALVAHEAFWFAWSQFHPGTAIWIP